MFSEIVLRDRQHAKIWIYNITTWNVMRDCYGYRFYLVHVFYSYTDFYKRQQRVHTRWNSSSIFTDENACKYNIKHKIKLTTKNQKAISEISGFSFLLTLIGILDDLFNMYSKIANQIYSFFASTCSTLNKIAYKLPH